MKNFYFKLISLSIALLLWYQVTNSIATLTLKLPLEVTNQPKDKILLTNVDNQIAVKIKGPSFLINSLSAKLPIIRKALPDDINGRYLVNIKKEDIDLSNSLEVISIEPSQIEYVFEKQVSKRVPVEVPRIGVPQQGYSVDEIKVNPEFVTINGALSELKSITSVETYPIDIRQAKENFISELTIRKPGKQVSTEFEQVQVLVKIGAQKASKTFEAVPVRFINDSSGKLCSLHQKTVSITVTALKNNSEKFVQEDLQPYVTLDANARPENLEVKLDYPKGVFSASIEPSRIGYDCADVKNNNSKKK